MTGTGIRTKVRTFGRPGPVVVDLHGVLQVTSEERTDADTRAADVVTLVGEVPERELTDHPNGQKGARVVHGLGFDTTSRTSAAPGQLVEVERMQSGASALVVVVVVEKIKPVRGLIIEEGASVRRNLTLKCKVSQ